MQQNFPQRFKEAAQEIDFEEAEAIAALLHLPPDSESAQVQLQHLSRPSILLAVSGLPEEEESQENGEVGGARRVLGQRH